jgi:RecA/RadA recombinase
MGELNTTVSALRKKFGDAILRMGNEIPSIRRIPIKELPAFDYASCGGLIHNRVNEFLGENGSGKSWVMYKYLGIYQRIDWNSYTMDALTKFMYNKDGTIKSFTVRKNVKKKVTDPLALRVALIDIEHTYTPEWGEKLGIDTKGLIVSQPDRLTTAVDIAVALCADPTISLVCIDSLSATGTDAEIDNDMESNQMGEAARFWNKAIRKIQSAMNSNPNENITLIVINSEYSGMSQYDTDKIRNGGQLKRSKSLSMRFRGQKELTDKDIVLGRNIILKCMKNKGGGPTFRTTNFFYAYTDYAFTPAYSTDVVNQIIDLAVKHEIVNRSGNTYEFEGCKAVGFEKFVTLIGTKDLLDDIRTRVYSEVINKAL